MTILDYIEETNSPKARALLLAARQFLEETLPPFASGSIKWKIPFYALRRNLCYLNRHENYITLGFPYGYKLAPRPGILLGESEKLKRVRYLEIGEIKDLYSETTRQVLQEAIMLDETLAKNKTECRRNFRSGVLNYNRKI
jgi:hypothetical protein